MTGEWYRGLSEEEKIKANTQEIAPRMCLRKTGIKN